MSLVDAERQWKQAVRENNEPARRDAEDEAAKSVPQIANRMAQMSHDEAQEYAER